MYSGCLHKKTPENRRIVALKKKFLGRFRVLEFFSTTWNDRNFLSSRALKKYYISINSCILVAYTRKHPKIGVWMPSKKNFWVGSGLSIFFSSTRNDRIYLSSRVLKKYYISIILCILVGYARKHPKIGISMPSKKNFCSVSGSRIFFDYTKWPNLSLFLGSKKVLHQHFLMYSGLLNKKTLEN